MQQTHAVHDLDLGTQIFRTSDTCRRNSRSPLRKLAVTLFDHCDVLIVGSVTSRNDVLTRELVV